MAIEKKESAELRPQTLSGFSPRRIISQTGASEPGKKTQIPRPRRWDVPFGEDMTDELVDEIFKVDFFARIDPDRFPANIPLNGIIRNDTRLCQFDKGEVIVREGDYGNSAFYIIKGKAQVILQNIPGEELGRSKPIKKSFLQSFMQTFNPSFFPETRDYTENEKSSHKQLSQGGLNIFLQDIPTVLDSNNTVTLKENELFGELGALGRTPRSSTIIAEEPATLLEIRWQGLRELRNFAPEWKKQIDQLYRERSLIIHLKNTPFLSGLTDSALQKVANETRFETYGNFDWHGEYKKHAEGSHAERLKIEPVIAKEDDYPNGLVLIRGGFARVSRKYNHGERTDLYLGKGEVFGLAELGANWLYEKHLPLKRTLRAIGYVDVLYIPTTTVEKYIFPHWDPKELEKVVQKELITLEATQDDTEGVLQEETLEFLVENRFINGTASMLIDLERCTRCDDCVRACASTHENNPRFIRNGPQVDSIMVANACMHCTDPVCMIGCPTGAIHREELQGQVVINDSTCIGCGTCANSCPYHNIHLVPVRDRTGHFILDESTGMPIQKATKCDLCVEEPGGPSCARACPHDAMIRADMSNIKEVAAFFNR